MTASRPRHDYPDDLAHFVVRKWRRSARPGQEDAAPPRKEVLEELLSVCYQASLMREEARPISFRLLFGDPSLISPFEGPPKHLQPLVFARPRPCDENELRRLAPALEFARSLVGVSRDGDGQLVIWGVIHSGTRWVHAVQGGRERPEPLPDTPVVMVRGPGEISVCRGDDLVATLRRGRVAKPAVNVFSSTWLPAFFEDTRREVMDFHAAARPASGTRWPEIEPEFLSTLAQNVIRRLISATRQERHGGTILFVPRGLPDDGAGSYIDLGYAFVDEPPRCRYRYLLEEAMKELAKTFSGPVLPEGRSEPRRVGWEAYAESRSAHLSEIDEAVFELAHLFASLSGVDGALVLDKQFQLLGFGGIISGSLEDTKYVDRSVDVEGTEIETEEVLGVGTRHRSVYRLISARPDVLAIVISQDGDVRFVHNLRGRVTYWDQMQETTI
jgi:hypothetical protein